MEILLPFMLMFAVLYPVYYLNKRRPSCAGTAPPPAPPDGTEPKYTILEVNGSWFLAVYKRDCNLWAEDFVGPHWAWWKVNRTFPDAASARAFGESQISEAQAKLASEHADQIFRQSLPG